MGRARRVLVCILVVGVSPAGAQEKSRPTFTTGGVALLANQSAGDTTELLRQALWILIRACEPWRPASRAPAAAPTSGMTVIFTLQ